MDQLTCNKTEGFRAPVANTLVRSPVLVDISASIGRRDDECVAVAAMATCHHAHDRIGLRVILEKSLLARKDMGVRQLRRQHLER